MPLILPGISTESRTALAIQEDMVALLSKRRTLSISRPIFLREYGKLRAELEATPEYQTFLAGVRGRTSKCEKCQRRKPSHVHHKVRMAIDPMKALEPSNALYVCKPCHQSFHPRARL